MSATLLPLNPVPQLGQFASTQVGTHQSFILLRYARPKQPAGSVVLGLPYWGGAMESEEFIRRLRGGDTRVFDDLMPTLLRLTYSACKQHGVIDDRREDFAQDVALKVFSKWQSFEGHSRLSTWIYSIASHTVLDALQLAQARRERTTAEADDPVLGEAATPLWAAAGASSSPEQRRCVQAVLDELEREPPARKGSMRKVDLLRWCVLNSPTTVELAAFLNTSEGAARQRMTYLRKEIEALCKHHCGTAECSLH
jgi:RNA polymerase sigma factor (sigma-70 family)